MNVILKSTWNSRWLPTENKKYLRTNCPSNLTKEEIAWLKDNNVLTVIDLREEIECLKYPCPLEKEKGFKYLHMPVSGGDVYPETPEEVLEAYKHMVDKKTFHIVDTLIKCKTKVIYFCASGKDRTGVVSALLLKKLGYDEQTIINDYMISKNNLLELLEYVKKEHPDKEIKSIIPDPIYIKTVLSL